MKSARQTAFEILLKIQRDNSYSNLVLDSVLEKSELERQDRAFATALVYGVVERRITLDYELSLYLAQPLKKLKPQVLTALRLGAYQLLYMDKVPASAAINETVRLTKNNHAEFASGLTNAVLHKIDKNGQILPEKDDKIYLSVRYSCPEWLCRMWVEAYGRENAEKLLESSLGSTDLIIRVNTLKTNRDELISLLEAEKIEAKYCLEVDDALIIRNSGAIHKSECYKKGLFHVQDTASQLCCKVLDVKSGNKVIDVCSAPGGKSFTLAEMMNNKGEVFSFDVYENRLKLINSGAERLGINIIKTKVNDGSIQNKNFEKVDRILCDVPCAGLGVIRKKPEIRYKSKSEVDKLPNLQYSILYASANYLKIGGILVYSTCSLNPEENEKVVERFLSEKSNFKSVRILDKFERYASNTDYISLMPHIHNCDGFFIAAFIKTEEDV